MPYLLLQMLHIAWSVCLCVRQKHVLDEVQISTEGQF